MTENEIVRRVLRRAVRGVSASAPHAPSVLEWARANAAGALDLKPAQAKALTWTALGRALRPACDEASAKPAGVLRLAADFARLMQLDPVDTAIVEVLFAADRLRPVSEALALLTAHRFGLAALVGEVAGVASMDAERRVRLNPLVRQGLVSFQLDRFQPECLEVRWTLRRLIDRLPQDAAEIAALMVGPRLEPRLPFSAFAHVEDAEFLHRLLTGARREGASGVNLLVHGPPGTGKTEFVRALAAEAGLLLHSAGEALDDGDEPDRNDRVAALLMGQRLLQGTGSLILFDEMEDLVGDARPSMGDWMSGRQGSKVFVNRLLETNSVPVIWTTNAIGNVDAAILRRMSHVLKMDLPSRATALRMLDHVAREEGVVHGADFARLVEAAPEAASVLRVAARSARLAGETDGGVRPARALVEAMRGVPLLPSGDGPVDLNLFEADVPIAPLFECFRESGVADISLLLTGPPGTGKTALAGHLARVLDRPLIVKRASDLLSKWVGETEQLIAEAFAEARHKDGVLLFDEADSLLFDRRRARANWEVSQVNELLTWLDRHPLPVVAATNHDARLDPATLRRFVFKLALRELDPARAARAFEQFFARPAPVALGQVRGLTPGDFALVARQLRHRPAVDAGDIVERLRAEVAARPGSSAPMGF